MAKTTFKGSIMLNPVPAVLITSRNSEGKDNVFTVGWVGTACTKPPMVTVAIRPERLSYEYIKEGNSFVVNLASTDLVKTVDYCGVRGGRTTDKFKDMNLTLSESVEINCGVIDQCPVSFECVVKSITPLGSHDLFLAEVVQCHVDDDIIDEKGKIHFDKADLLTYSHGEYFGINPQPIGKFGYSVRKKPATKKVDSKKPEVKSTSEITNTKKSTEIPILRKSKDNYTEKSSSKVTKDTYSKKFKNNFSGKTNDKIASMDKKVVTSKNTSITSDKTAKNHADKNNNSSKKSIKNNKPNSKKRTRI